jgi:hypothetical protein
MYTYLYPLSVLAGLILAHGIIGITRFHAKASDTARLYTVRWNYFMTVKDKNKDESSTVWAFGWIALGLAGAVTLILCAPNQERFTAIFCVVVGGVVDTLIFLATRPKGNSRYRSHYREDDGTPHLSTPAEKMAIAERIAREHSKRGTTPTSSLDGYSPTLIRRDTPHGPPTTKK